MTNSISDKSIFQGTKKSNWQNAVEDFKRREEAYASTLELKDVDDRHLLFAKHKHKQNVEILDILTFLESRGMTGWVGYAKDCVEKSYLDKLRSLKSKIENTSELPITGTTAYMQFVADGLGVGPKPKTPQDAVESDSVSVEPEAATVVTEEPVAPAPAKGLSSYMLQALDSIEKTKAEYKKQQGYKDAGVMMTSERYDVKIKNCSEIQEVLHDLSDLGVEGWVGYAEGRDEQPYLFELKQLKKAIEDGGVIPPAGTDEYMQFVGSAMGRKNIPAAKDYPADHSLDLLGDVGLDRSGQEAKEPSWFEDVSDTQEKTNDIIICWGSVARTVCSKVKNFALASIINVYDNPMEIAIGAVTGCLTKSAFALTFGVAAGGVTLPVLAIAGIAGACSGTLRAAYRNQKRVNAFNATAMLDAEASLPQWGPVYRESLGVAALKGVVAGVVGGYLGAQFFDVVSHTSFGHWLRDLFVAKTPAIPSKIPGVVTRPSVNSTGVPTNTTTLNSTVASTPAATNASSIRMPVTKPTALGMNATVTTSNSTGVPTNATTLNSTGALAPAVLPQTQLIGMDSLKDVLTQDQMAKLPKRIVKLAASGKPEDMLCFYKEASFHYLNKVGGKSMDKIGAELIERGVKLADQSNITNGTAQKLFADYSFVKAWGRGLVADQAVAIDYAKRAGEAVNNFGGRLLKLFGTAAQATTTGETVLPIAPKQISLPKVSAPRLAA